MQTARKYSRIGYVIEMFCWKCHNMSCFRKALFLG